MKRLSAGSPYRYHKVPHSQEKDVDDLQEFGQQDNFAFQDDDDKADDDERIYDEVAEVSDLTVTKFQYCRNHIDNQKNYSFKISNHFDKSSVKFLSVSVI